MSNRTNRTEREALKQQVAQQASGSSLAETLHLLETLWGISPISQPALPLQEARTRLAQGLPPKWSSRQIQSQRNRR